MPIHKSYEWFKDKEHFEFFDAQQKQISAPILNEIRERLYFLYDVAWAILL